MQKNPKPYCFFDEQTVLLSPQNSQLIRRNQELRNPQSESAPTQQANGRIKSKKPPGQDREPTPPKNTSDFLPKLDERHLKRSTLLGNLNPSNNKIPKKQQIKPTNQSSKRKDLPTIQAKTKRPRRLDTTHSDLCIKDV
jgi:hypothetical protein